MFYVNLYLRHGFLHLCEETGNKKQDTFLPHTTLEVSKCMYETCEVV